MREIYIKNKLDTLSASASFQLTYLRLSFNLPEIDRADFAKKNQQED